MPPHPPSITISGLPFVRPSPRYRPGHICTPAEAEVLNSVLLERVRGNLIRRGKDRKTPLTQEEFEEYYNCYQLGIGPQEKDPVEIESIKIARALLAEIMNKEGKSLRDLNKEDLSERIRELSRKDHVREEATKRIILMNEIASELLEWND